MTDNLRTSLVLGITGGIACGKSEVGRILGKMGFSVLDADGVAHGLMKKGMPAYRNVLDHFGTRILSGDGEISRAVLGKIVFENPDEREVLNGLVHPAVRKKLAVWIAERRRLGEHAAGLVPLMHESGIDQLDWDAVLCVSSSEEQVLQRLEQRGMSREEAGLRMRAQMPLAEKEARADHVVHNNGTLEMLAEATRNAVNQVKAER